MGHTYYVWAWRNDVGEIYRWFCIFEGENRAAALASMDEAAKAGDKCLKIEWRR